MPHVFVETNWLFAYAAPAHHQISEAAKLFDRASRGDFVVHMPNICIAEARKAILAKCQPRNEAKAIRQFLTWGQPEFVTKMEAEATRVVLDKYESRIKHDLDNLENTLRTVASSPFIEIYGLDDAMLDRATELSLAGLALKPFDHAVLASVLVRAEKLWEAGERGISFCEVDADLQPWDKYGNAKPPLRDAFERAHVWVYSDFTLAQPQRRQDFE